jgi:hypothetical protein
MQISLAKFPTFTKEAQKKILEYYACPPTLLKKPLSKDEPIAYMASTSLGDTLIGLVKVNNLLRNGYIVHVYSDYAYPLKDWFPHMQINPMVKLEEQKKLAAYSTVLHHHERPISLALAAWHPNSVVVHHEPACRLPISEVDIQLVSCDAQFHLENLTRENGMRPLPGLVPRSNKKLVMIHPTSSADQKAWFAHKFISLAKRVEEMGFTPRFVVSKAEHARWIETTHSLDYSPLYPTLNAAAVAICEANYFIGNDSGLGHLASNLGIPTTTITIRPGNVKRWRPTWAPNEIIITPGWLNPRPIKEKFWKHFISVDKVADAFQRLIAKS